MDVIPFPMWRVFFYEEDGVNVIRRWLDEQEASLSDREALQALIDICEYSGPDAVSSCTLDLGDGFFALLSRRKGGLELSPIFYLGPFSESEITFLAGALFSSRKTLIPSYAKGIAQENLGALQRDPTRRCREPVT